MMTMQTSPVPWKVLSSHLGLGVLTDGWCLDARDDSEGAESRCFRIAVVFDLPFSSVPVVQLGLTGFDIDQRDTARVSLRVADITPTGFMAEVWTWANTRVYAVEFNWLAIGA